ncbi:MAG: hypothetical protein ACK5UM_04885 [Pseudomonadota bacterium]|jgi:hypothetical protein|nr:hypothetical protein [Rubrivivax sp.]MCA3258119.1 hypothetical protein [Rubrivivax sp.]MCE2912279.1 hypothetical protein [Rubrivivax sp.]MCZ8031438.1 hypothetical protein [Rubrivivax sp.]
MNKTSITLKSPKPRNPFVAAARARRAGAHRPRPGAVRAQARSALRAELQRGLDRAALHPPSSP